MLRKKSRIERRHGQPWGENCWYFTETGEQFPMADRVAQRNRLTPMGASHPDPVFQTALSTWWQDLSHKAGQQFLWPHASTARSNADAFLPLAVSIYQVRMALVELLPTDRAEPVVSLDTHDKTSNHVYQVTIEEHFCLLLLVPVMVSRLELTGEPQNRWIYLRDRDLLWSRFYIFIESYP